VEVPGEAAQHVAHTVDVEVIKSGIAAVAGADPEIILAVRDAAAVPCGLAGRGLAQAQIRDSCNDCRERQRVVSAAVVDAHDLLLSLAEQSAVPEDEDVSRSTLRGMLRQVAATAGVQVVPGHIPGSLNQYSRCCWHCRRRTLWRVALRSYLLTV